MEVSGQLHAPAALPPGKELLVPIGQEGGWAPELLFHQIIPLVSYFQRVMLLYDHPERRREDVKE
jgi:hypothetical protein